MRLNHEDTKGTKASLKRIIFVLFFVFFVSSWFSMSSRHGLKPSWIMRKSRNRCCWK